MRMRMTTLAVLLAGFTGVLFTTAAQAQEKEPPCDGCALLETKSFADDEARAARDYANSHSGPTGASVNGVPFVYRSTVRVVKGNMGQHVYVVKIWMCPDPPAAGGGK